MPKPAASQLRQRVNRLNESSNFLPDPPLVPEPKYDPGPPAEPSGVAEWPDTTGVQRGK